MRESQEKTDLIVDAVFADRRASAVHLFRETFRG